MEVFDELSFDQPVLPFFILGLMAAGWAGWMFVRDHVFQLAEAVHQLLCPLLPFLARVFLPECDIRMDFDTNEYPNIFVSKF